MRAAVIGSPVSHSLSPVLHAAAYRDVGVVVDYRAIEVSTEELPAFLASLDESWVGLSVTMPNKQAIIADLDVVDSLARTVGAVNTVCLQPPSRMLVGFNTDVEGIVTAVREARTNLAYPSAMILGSRATASSAIAASVQLGAPAITLAARNHGGPGSALSAATRMNLKPTLAKLTDDWIGSLPHTGLLISTLPGRVADEYASRIESSNLDLAHLTLLDVNYRPYPSALTRAVAARGGTCVPGWTMLLHQGLAQVRLFTGRTPNPEVVREQLREAIR